MDPKLLVELILKLNQAAGVLAPVFQAVAKIRDAAGGDFPPLATSLDANEETVKKIVGEGQAWLDAHPELAGG